MIEPLNYMAAAERINSRLTKNGAFLTVKTGDRINVMTIGWGNIGYIWGRPIMTVAVRPTRHTFALIEKADDFTVSVPIPDKLQALAFCGSHSGRDLDKFTAAGLVTIEARKTHSPVIKVPGIHVEARIVLRCPIDPVRMLPELGKFYPEKDYHTIYFGEILECYETDFRSSSGKP